VGKYHLPLRDSSGMFGNEKTSKGMFRNVQEYSGMFGNVRECL